MKIAKTALTDRAIKAAKPAARAYDMHDAVVPGLAVRVLSSAVKSFVLVARFPGSRNPTRRSLGAYGALSLEAARKKARAWLELIARNIDPAKEVERERREQERKQRTTFAAMVEGYIANAVIGPDPDKPRHRNPGRILNSLRDVLVPLFGERPVTELTADDIMPPLELIGRIGTDRALVKLGVRKTLRRPGRKVRPCPEQARSLFTFAEMVFNWALDHGGYGLERSPLDRISKTRRLGATVRRDHMLNDEELAALVLAIPRLPVPHRHAYQVLLHSGLRLNEAVGARWSEIEDDVWTIPAQRMKGRNAGQGQARAHVVPVTPALRKVFDAVPRGTKGDFIFSVKDGAAPIATGGTQLKAMLDDEMLHVLRQRAKARGEDPDKVALRAWRNHDLRRSCRSTLARLRIDSDTAEAVLAHRRPGMKAIYDVWERYDEKREALTAWSKFLADLVRPRPVKTTRRERATIA
jgi:integrase